MKQAASAVLLPRRQRATYNAVFIQYCSYPNLPQFSLSELSVGLLTLERSKLPSLQTALWKCHHFPAC